MFVNESIRESKVEDKSYFLQVTTSSSVQFCAKLHSAHTQELKLCLCVVFVCWEVSFNAMQCAMQLKCLARHCDAVLSGMDWTEH